MIEVFFPKNRGWAYAKQYCQQRGIIFFKDDFLLTHSVMFEIPIKEKPNISNDKPLVNKSYPTRRSNLGSLLLISAMLGSMNHNK